MSEAALFAPLSDEETQQIAETVEAKIFAAGEKIVRRGQDGKSMFVIHRGAVNVQINEDGKINILRSLSEGDFFGEMGLFTGEPRTATVIATEETEVLEINHNCLKPILKANPDLVERFVEIIEERRVKLTEIHSEHKTDTHDHKSGMFDSIRKFFGLGN